MNRKKSLIIIFISMFYAIHMDLHRNYASEKPLSLYRKTLWTSHEGLPQNVIYNITQTPDGYIWMGTDSGIARFDGAQFDVFTHDKYPNLTDNIIQYLLLTDDGNLWIATRQGGILKYANGEFTRNYTQKTGLLSNNVLFLYQSSDHDIWIGTANGLNRLEKGKISPITLPRCLISQSVGSIIEDDYGQIWGGTPDGLFVLRKENKRYNVVYTDQLNNHITTLAKDREGRIWAGTNKNGIIRYSKEGKHYINKKNGLSGNIISAIYIDQHNSVWIASHDGGIDRLKDGKIINLDNKQIFPNGYATAIFVDREKSVWIGTSGGGVSLLSDSKIVSYSIKNGLSYDQVYGIFADSRGDVLVGTFGFGLDCIRDGKVHHTITTDDGLPGNIITSVGEDLNGNIWIGTLGNGITHTPGSFIHNFPGNSPTAESNSGPTIKTFPGNKKHSNPFTTYTTKDGLISDFIYSVYCDRKGNIWVGTDYGGLHRFSPSTNRFEIFKITGGKIRAMLEDTHGNLWVGSSTAGLLRIQNDNIRIFDDKNGLSCNDVTCIFEDSGKDLWIGTYGGGLNRFRSYKSGRFDPLRKKDGLPHDILFWILEDNFDNIWISTMEGIGRINLNKLKSFFSNTRVNLDFEVFDESDGMKIRECNGGSQPSGTKTKDGKLWFLTASGIAMIDPDRMKTNTLPPGVTIKKVIIANREYPPGPLITSPPGYNNIEVYYAGLSYVSPERVKFKYKLEPYDKDWNDAGTRRTALYTNIPPGTYSFRVKACNNDMIWNENGASFKILIPPQYWQTWWFNSLVTFSIIGVVWLLYSLRIRKIKTHQRLLEQLVNERTQTLRNKTIELERKTIELEKTNSIVKSINEKVDYEDILFTILRETAELEHIKRAVALVYDRSISAYKFLASVGYDIEMMRKIQFSFQEAESRYIRNSIEISKNIFIAKNLDQRPGADKVREIGIPLSILVLRIPMENTAAGYLLFENMEDEDAFDQKDIQVLAKLQDHFTSALIKSKLLLDLKAEREVAEEANHSKGLFLARMSHEIRTPMNSVIGFADMLIDTELNDEQKEFAQNITKCGEALLYLIDEILDFSKIEAGHLSFQPVDFDPQALAFDVCRLMQPKVNNETVEIFCRISDRMPPYVKADSVRYRQVLVNLIGNAAKFTTSGEIELSIHIDEETTDSIKLHAIARDTGIGISHDQLPHIFDLFHQADGSITRKYGGTGLGLAISRQIAGHMGGDIWAESEPQKGSIFHFTAWVEKSHKNPIKRNDYSHLKGKHALFADDHPINLDIFRHIAETAGMTCAAVDNSAAVLNIIRRNQAKEKPFDIVVLDIPMLEADTHDLAQTIRKDPDPKIANLPIIAYSSSTEKQTRMYRDMGFDGFLLKPIQPHKLLSLMTHIFLGKNEKHSHHERRKTTNTALSQESIDDTHSSICILLAEDNPLNQKLARVMLTKAGYNLDVAQNGKEAVEMYTANPGKYDLIFMDVNMPEMDGLEATRLIRENGFIDVPIIAITADALKEDREKCLKFGMDDYMPKPIKRELVFNMVKKWILKEA